MSESNDYKTFKKNVPGPLDRLDRVENVVMAGMPDTSLCIEGVEMWIEFKSPIEPKRESTKLFGSNHKLSQDQKNWFLRQRTAGGACFILIATDKRWMLIHGRSADSLNDVPAFILERESLWSAAKPVRDKRQWTELRNVLKMESMGMLP
jgi:hypothetical protein